MMSLQQVDSHIVENMIDFYDLCPQRILYKKHTLTSRGETHREMRRNSNGKPLIHDSCEAVSGKS